MEKLYTSLLVRSQKLSKALTTMTNVTCSPINGALYAFPTINLPRKAVDAAKLAGMPPDTFYAVELLDNTGICVVPGNGFKQQVSGRLGRKQGEKG
eukprot:1230784-Rhodomonas_salina.1